MSELSAITGEDREHIQGIIGSDACVYENGMIVDRLVSFDDMAAIVDYLKSQQVVSSLGNMQVGGGHYQKKIQPVEYIHANDLPFIEGNVVKYISRHKAKDGAYDIEKAISYCKILLKLEYGYTDEQIGKLFEKDGNK